jgi:DNA-binding NarL/FixJ family response regulator
VGRRPHAPASASCPATSARGNSVEQGIGERLVITEAAVRKHVGSIFAKLDLPSGDDAHRRILAVLVYLSRQRQGESIGM